MFFPGFDVLCDPLLNRRTTGWNLFFYIITQKMLMASCIHPLTDLATDIYPPPPVDHIYEPINMGEQFDLLYNTRFLFPWSNAFLS